MFIDPEVALKSDKIQALAEKSITAFRSRAPATLVCAMEALRAREIGRSRSGPKHKDRGEQRPPVHSVTALSPG